MTNSSGRKEKQAHVPKHMVRTDQLSQNLVHCCVATRDPSLLHVWMWPWNMNERDLRSSKRPPSSFTYSLSADRRGLWGARLTCRATRRQGPDSLNDDLGGCHPARHTQLNREDFAVVVASIITSPSKHTLMKKKSDSTFSCPGCQGVSEILQCSRDTWIWDKTDLVHIPAVRSASYITLNYLISLYFSFSFKTMRFYQLYGLQRNLNEILWMPLAHSRCCQSVKFMGI